MTLAPAVHPSVRGLAGKPIEIERGTKCRVPGCLSNAQQRHHMWPKSFLRGQPYEWVTVHGHTIPNSIGLCMRHHDQVTGMVGRGHFARIVYDEDLNVLWWEQRDSTDDDYHRIGPLRGQTLAETQPEAARVRQQEGLCPTCGKPHARKKPAGPKRKAKTWGISVPDDAEHGTDVLDTYIKDLGVLMGLDPESPRLFRYHVLVPVLEWVMQNRVEFLADWKEDE